MTEQTQTQSAGHGSNAEGSSKAIIAALTANLGIAVLKFVAFLLTRSSAMLAESIHSVADSANQILLIIGGKRSQRQPDAEHAFGFGQVRYLYAFLVSIVIFSVGGLFALYEAWEKFHDPHGIEGPWWWVPLVILLASIGLEGRSFMVARRESMAGGKHPSLRQFIRATKEPELPVVLLEDAAAVAGLIFALFGVGLTLLTGNGLFDAIATALIGFLLVAVAVVLSRETTSLLVGESASKENLDAIEKALLGQGVSRVIHLRTVHQGPDELLVAAKIAVEKTETGADIAEAINAAEQRVRVAVPIAKWIYLEPDIYSAAQDTRLVQGGSSPQDVPAADLD